MQLFAEIKRIRMIIIETRKYSLFKNGIHLHDFNTIKDCAIWLENIIGGSLYEGLRGLRDGWKPMKHSQLHFCYYGKLAP